MTVHEELRGSAQVAEQMKMDEKYQIHQEPPKKLLALEEAAPEPMETDEQMVEGIEGFAFFSISPISLVISRVRMKHTFES